MEEFKPKFNIEPKEKEIIFSKALKAGKRIYYLDVKKNKKEELFLTITESKKIVTGFDEDIQVVYEKHKIFLYQEDFDKFTTGLEEVIEFVKGQSVRESVDVSMDSYNFKMEEFE